MSGYVDNDDTDIENLSESFINAQKEAGFYIDLLNFTFKHKEI